MTADDTHTSSEGSLPECTRVTVSVNTSHQPRLFNAMCAPQGLASGWFFDEDAALLALAHKLLEAGIAHGPGPRTLARVLRERWDGVLDLVETSAASKPVALVISNMRADPSGAVIRHVERAPNARYLAGRLESALARLRARTTSVKTTLRVRPLIEACSLAHFFYWQEGRQREWLESGSAHSADRWRVPARGEVTVVLLPVDADAPRALHPPVVADPVICTCKRSDLRIAVLALTTVWAERPGADVTALLARPIVREVGVPGHITVPELDAVEWPLGR